MNFTKITLFFLLIIFTFSIPVNAQVINGDFEWGNLTGWDLYDANGIYPSINSYTASWGGDYSVRLYSNNMWYTASIIQDIDWDDYKYLNFSAARSGTTGQNSFIRAYAYVDDEWITLYSSSSFPISWHNRSYNVSEYSGLGKIKFSGRNWYSNEYAYFDNIELSGYAERIPESFIQFEDTPYNEYDNAIVNFSVETIMSDYPDKRIYLEIATPKITEPYYNYVAYELNDFTGYRGLEITGKSPATSAYDNCTAYIRAYDMDMGNYETLLEIETPVLTDNHTLLNYTQYNYPINKSYITGQYIYIDVDIMDYIETNFLGWPDEYFLLHVDAFSNSNQGDRDYEYHIDSIYWDADRYHVHHFSMQPYSSIDSDFNATIQSYITVYRNGNTTRLTPTINTSMWSSGYIPEGEEGYNPPDIPEEPEDPEISDPEPEPEPEPDPPIPPTQPNGTGANQSINVSWTGEYYNTVNDTFIGLCSPIYNFTNWSLSPVHSLNSSIGEFNYYMNESFTQTAQDSNILYDSINTIYGAIHPKIRNVITYYLIWVVLLIVLKKD